MFDMKLYVMECNLERLKKLIQNGNISVEPVPYSTQDIDKLNGYMEISMSYSDFMNLKEAGKIYPVNL